MTIGSKTDAYYMAKAIKLAEKGLYTTDPNPRVGCLIVKEDRVIAEGWHARAGQGHAEVEALMKVNNAKGATAYVTLEPCSHHGQTPPCCDALIAAGMARVVAAMQDPNPLVSGQGLARLRASGIDVECGVLHKEAEKLNPGFIKRMQTGLPWVRSKLAMSLDGRTAMASGESKWITSEPARADVHTLRARSSAVLTGINTVLADDPSFNARVDWDIVQPARLVLDSALQMPLTAQMLALPGRTLIFTVSEDRAKMAALQDAGAEVFNVAEKNGRVDLSQVLKQLGQLQVNELMVEAGSILNGALLADSLVDEWVIYMATCILGDRGRGLFSMPSLEHMADRKQLKLEEVRHVGPDLKLILNGR